MTKKLTDLYYSCKSSETDEDTDEDKEYNKRAEADEDTDEDKEYNKRAEAAIISNIKMMLSKDKIFINKKNPLYIKVRDEINENIEKMKAFSALYKDAYDYNEEEANMLKDIDDYISLIASKLNELIEKYGHK